MYIAAILRERHTMGPTGLANAIYILSFICTISVPTFYFIGWNVDRTISGKPTTRRWRYGVLALAQGIPIAGVVMLLALNTPEEIFDGIMLWYDTPSWLVPLGTALIATSLVCTAATLLKVTAQISARAIRRVARSK